jgi:glycosyltransferase involved in cell wall biosynthesis
MPCFNHARFLRESVDAILQQTFKDFELIIVDDCSSDDSWEVIRSIANRDSRIRAFKHELNQGASKSRNDALQAANGAYIGFCDADDIWESEKLEIQVNFLQNDPEYDLVYCDAAIIDEKGALTGERFSEWFPPPTAASGNLFGDLVGRNFINIQSVLMRKECGGQFDEKIKWVEDWWYWIKASHDHRFRYSKEPLARYRVHSMSTNVVQRRGYRFNRYKVFKRILRDYANIPNTAKADILYKMGVDLCGLGKRRAGRRLFLSAVEMAIRDLRAINSLPRAAARALATIWPGT